MQFIFDSVFKGSKHVGREIEVARFLSESLLLAVSLARVEVPSGPWLRK